MGIRDRSLLEQLTSQVIERLEKAQQQALPTLPGMEDLVDGSKDAASGDAHRSRNRSHGHGSPQCGKTGKTRTQNEEVKAEMETEEKVPQEKQINRQRADRYGLAGLGKALFNKRQPGKVIETPDEMFRRVARAIAAAELYIIPRPM